MGSVSRPSIEFSRSLFSLQICTVILSNFSVVLMIGIVSFFAFLSPYDLLLLSFVFFEILIFPGYFNQSDLLKSFLFHPHHQRTLAENISFQPYLKTIIFCFDNIKQNPLRFIKFHKHLKILNMSHTNAILYVSFLFVSQPKPRIISHIPIHKFDPMDTTSHIPIHKFIYPLI